MSSKCGRPEKVETVVVSEYTVGCQVKVKKGEFKDTLGVVEQCGKKLHVKLKSGEAVCGPYNLFKKT